MPTEICKVVYSRFSSLRKIKKRWSWDFRFFPTFSTLKLVKDNQDYPCRKKMPNFCNFCGFFISYP